MISRAILPTVLLPVLLLSGASGAAAQAPTFVSDLTLSAHAERSRALAGCTGASKPLAADLNEGAGGEVIFLCITEAAHAQTVVTGITVTRSREGCVRKDARMLPIDLNQGAGGISLFLCLVSTASPGDRAIRTIGTHAFARAPALPFDVICRDAARFEPVAYDGSTEPADVNMGAGGKYIYLCIRRSEHIR